MKCSAITGSVFEQHNRADHIECDDRLRSIIARLPEDLTIRAPVAAEKKDLLRIHDPGYLSWLRRQCALHTDKDGFDTPGCTCGYFVGSMFIPGFLDANTYLCPQSCDAVTYAAGSAVAAAERALAGENCFALVRPPGHHAASGWAMGFCIVNNIAVAAAKALTSVDRVAIVDWDVHHGNGTQDIFYGSDRVLYCSIHADNFFPHTGAAGEIGTGAGKGYTVNVPLPQTSTVSDYSCAFSEIVLPVLERFRPDLVLVSAGQDGLDDDPVGGMGLKPADYALFTELLLDATDGSLALTLEGGYGPSNPEAVRNIVDVLCGHRTKREIPAPSKTTVSLIATLKKLHHLSP